MYRKNPAGESKGNKTFTSAAEKNKLFVKNLKKENLLTNYSCTMRQVEWASLSRCRAAEVMDMVNSAKTKTYLMLLVTFNSEEQNKIHNGPGKCGEACRWAPLHDTNHNQSKDCNMELCHD